MEGGGEEDKSALHFTLYNQEFVLLFVPERFLNGFTFSWEVKSDSEDVFLLVNLTGKKKLVQILKQFSEILSY